MNKNTVGERIRLIRSIKGLTQEDLAQRLKTSQNQIYKYEKDRNEPTASVIIEIAHILDTTADYLLGFSDNPQRPIRNEQDLTDLERELIEVLRRKSDQHNLEDLVNFLKAVG